MLDAVNYRNASKNHWRKVAWNHIARLVDNPRTANVVYLPGSSNADRVIAAQKGFDPRRMIAVERDGAVAALIRSRDKITTIEGDLVQIIDGWGRDTIDVLIADLQCGIGATSDDLAILHSVCPALARAVVLVNLQRGRDDVSGWAALREGEDPTACDLEKARRQGYFGFHGFTTPEMPAEGEKNRAFRYVCQVASYQIMLGLTDRAMRTLESLSSVDDAHHWARWWMRRRQTRFLPSYRSSPRSPYFDGVVMRWDHFAVPSFSRFTHRSVAAAKAIRTSKLLGKLPPPSRHVFAER